MTFEPWMAIPLWLAVTGGLAWLAKTDTRVGRNLRSTEHDAWEMAVESKQRELAELLAAEPRQGDA